MTYFHHGTIKKYTAAIIDLFNDIETATTLSDASVVNKRIPIVYASREKSSILDGKIAQQLLDGNHNVLPRGSVALVGMSKNDVRSLNKNNKTNLFKTDTSLEYTYTSVPYNFTFTVTFICRGMNEASQIIEQVCPKFNPVANVSVWDVSNLSEPTTIALSLASVDLTNEDYNELTANIFTVSFTIELTGNLYQPINIQNRVKEFKMYINEIDGEYYDQRKILGWEVGPDGLIVE